MYRQIAALPVQFTADGKLHLYLVTSRGSGQWIIPKGNPIPGLSAHEVAAQEALEEAGLVGSVMPVCVGTFEFERTRRLSGSTCIVDVYPMHVEKQVSKFDEQRQRRVLRCDLETALSVVSSKPLAALIERYGRQCGSTRRAVG
ncbi:MAG: NUDIX hydrolase [Aestuariivirga sp.]|uniref:NUDIX hydrolase n=1 Tax=Aestuariivirga sp. TaxID=2650926 RepID=UPI00301A20E9